MAQRPDGERKAGERALALWLNTSLGLIVHWVTSNHTQNGLGHLSKKQAEERPGTDVTQSDPDGRLDRMAETFDQVRKLSLLPANEAWRDRDGGRSWTAGCWRTSWGWAQEPRSRSGPCATNGARSPRCRAHRGRAGR